MAKLWGSFWLLGGVLGNLMGTLHHSEMQGLYQRLEVQSTAVKDLYYIKEMNG